MSTSSKPCEKCGTAARYDDGHCIACKKIYLAKYRLENAAVIKKSKQEYRASNVEKELAYKEKYRAENKEAIQKYNAHFYQNNIERERARVKKYNAENPDIAAKWQLANPEKAKAKSKRWAMKNRELVNTIQPQRRRAAKLNAIPKWFNELDELVIAEAAKLCRMRLKATGIKWNVDHIVPLQSKLVCGFHIGCNIQLLPATLNSSKGNRHWPNM